MNRLTLPLALILLFSCAKNEMNTLGENLVHAIRTNDEAEFLRLHVQPGDKTPSGNYWLVTKAGGSRPDEGWNEELRRALRDVRQALEQNGAKVASLELDDIQNVTVYQIDNDKDRSNLSNLVLRVDDGDNEYLLTFTEGMLSGRGWVVAGEPAVSVKRP